MSQMTKGFTKSVNIFLQTHSSVQNISSTLSKLRVLINASGSYKLKIVYIKGKKAIKRKVRSVFFFKHKIQV